MKKIAFICIAGLLISLCSSVAVQAAETDTAKSTSKESQEKQKQERYVLLLKDNGFAYYLDTKNVRWMKIPYSETENIVDAWVRLVKIDDDGEYSYPPKYFLSHYYIRPKTRQIQFLSELEVTGRPDNAIAERPYSSLHWENLVPGSIEDDIYHGVLKVMEEKSIGGSSGDNMSLRDAVEEYLRISL